METATESRSLTEVRSRAISTRSRPRRRNPSHVLFRADIEDPDHAGVGVVDDVAVEEPEAGMREGELQRVRLAGQERQHLCGPARALERSDRDVRDAVCVEAVDLVADVDHVDAHHLADLRREHRYGLAELGGDGVEALLAEDGLEVVLAAGMPRPFMM